jgi:carotenoid cleavage dioxygenase
MTDEKTLTEPPVTGLIPESLDGRYLRSGRTRSSRMPPGHHWFTGDGMVHGVALRTGRALWYRNRWIRSECRQRGAGQAARARAAPRRQ